MLTTCYPHNITYDDDRYEDGCPVCYWENEAAKYKKQVDNWENKEIECFADGQQDILRILRSKIAINRAVGHSDSFILDEIEQLIKKGE